jgi:hypothetical protein
MYFNRKLQKKNFSRKAAKGRKEEQEEMLL